jgi:tRNA(Ile)-lysidine synthase
LYHVLVHFLAQRTLDYIRGLDLLKAGDRVGVAVSGGGDSVALLRLLLELRSEIGIVLSVVHFNHKLRGVESDEDEKFVAGLARACKLEFQASSGNVAAEAAANRLSIETAARRMRHSFFRQLQKQAPDGSRRLDKVATGHTLDDQAETVLMRLIRGTGTRGLSGIYPAMDLTDDDNVVGEVVRPLLAVRHRELEHFLRGIGQSWREDSSNRDPKHTRNRVRHLLLPLLEREFNPAITGALSDLAEIAREEEDYWDTEVSGWIGTAIHWSEPDWLPQSAQGKGQALVRLQPFHPEVQRRLQEPGPLVKNAAVDLLWLLSEPVAVQRRAIKAVGDLARLPLEFKHVQEILRFAAKESNSGKELSLPLGWKLRRELEALAFLTPDLRIQERIPVDYEYALPLPGRAMVPEAGIVVEAVQINSDSEPARQSGDQLLDPALLEKHLTVRNWRPGDRFWPIHSKAAKKIKELLQERHITEPDRRLWPVVASGDEIIWVRGFPGPARFRPKADAHESILIRDLPLENEE